MEVGERFHHQYIASQKKKDKLCFIKRPFVRSAQNFKLENI